jgi:hypothetical protein
MLKHIIIALCTLAVVSTPAIARVNLNFDIQVAPPPPQDEVVPAPRPDFVWAPGYWAWENGR